MVSPDPRPSTGASKFANDQYYSSPSYPDSDYDAGTESGGIEAGGAGTETGAGEREAGRGGDVGGVSSSN